MPVISSFPGGSGNGGGGGVPLAAVTGIVRVPAHNRVYIKWTDPEDIAVGEQKIAEWAGTLLVRKAGSAPNSRHDGQLVIDSRERNQYQDGYLCDAGVTDGIEYFYKFFPYTIAGAYTDKAEDLFTATPAAIAPGNVTGLEAMPSGNGKVTVKWTDPEDTVVNGVTVCAWGGAKVVYKPGSAPENAGDGTLFRNVVTKDQYSADGLQVTGLENGQEYYFGVFPYADAETGGLANNDIANVVAATPHRLEIEAEPAQDGTLTYSGDAQTPRWRNYTEDRFDVTGADAQTDAGAYTAHFTPRDDYCWPGGGRETRDVPWVIDRAELPAPTTDKQEIALDAQTLEDSFTVAWEGGGALSVEMDVQDIVTTQIVSDTVTVRSVDGKTGNVTLTIHIAQSKNYNAYTADDVTVTVRAQFLPEKKPLNDMTWEEISMISDADQGSNYWAVGDRKAVKVSGRVGAVRQIDSTFYAYILGFDHNEEIEGKGIHFGCFMTALTGGKGVCLRISSTNNSHDGHIYGNMNHWGDSSSPYNTNYGGWAACDLRYDILGSTNQQPNPYGKEKTTSATGKDPTETCATEPVANTLMAALPADLRAVMKPMTKYTDNTGNMSTSPSNVTATIDYLPLLAMFEVLGAGGLGNINKNEQIYQKQYSYYESGNSPVKYWHNDLDTAESWWSRSPISNNDRSFCVVNSLGSYASVDASNSRAIAPIFKV